MLSSLAGILFFVMLLTTEFFYIEAFGGVLRPYHFFLIIILAIFLSDVPKLLQSSTFRCLVLVNIISIISAILSADPGTALTSYALLALNSSIAVAVAILVNCRILTIDIIISILYKTSIVSGVFSLIQFGSFRISGINLALSDQQLGQIASGFAPSLFTEANTYAKFLIVPFFIFIPIIVRRGFSSRLSLFYIIISFAFLINFMRTAFFGAITSVVIGGFYYLYYGRFTLFAKRFLHLLWFGPLIFIIVIGTGFSISEYNIYKFSTLFDMSAASTDVSWRYRSRLMEIAIEQTLSDPYKIILGHGWGQVYGYVGFEKVQLGGADLVSFFIYDGVLGVVPYVMMLFFALRGAVRRARRTKYAYERNFAEGVFLALVACTTAAFVSGMILMPSFWFLIGMTIVFDCANARDMAGRHFVLARSHTFR